MLVSTLVPLGLVLAAGVVAIGVVRARHRKNVGESQGAACPLPAASSPEGTAEVHPLSSAQRKGLGKGRWGTTNAHVPETSIRCCRPNAVSGSASSVTGVLSSQGGAPGRGGQGPANLGFQPGVRTSQLGGAGRPLHTSGVHTA